MLLELRDCFDIDLRLHLAELADILYKFNKLFTFDGRGFSIAIILFKSFRLFKRGVKGERNLLSNIITTH